MTDFKRFTGCLAGLVVLLAVHSGAADAARIAFLTDLHVNLKTNGAGSLFNKNLDKMIGAVNAARVDLVLLGGDLTDQGTPEQMDLFLARIANFSAPVFLVPGNHDVGRMRTKAGLNTLTQGRLTAFEDRLGPLFFARQQAGVRVIGITSPLLCSGLEAERAQWDFLEKALAVSNAAPTLLLTHYPVFYKHPGESPNDYWITRPSERARFLGLLKKGGVRAVLSGHIHRKLVLEHDGISFITTGAIANRAPRPEKDHRFFWVLLTVSPGGKVTHEFKQLK